MTYETRFERLELKYLVDEQRVDRVREHLGSFCRSDEHSSAGQGYPIRSLYLDTPALAFHAAKEWGDPNRIKLRVRTYSATSPATLEIKRRHSNVIDKTRAVVDRSRVEEAVSGVGVPTRAAAYDGFLHDFARLVATSGARPTLNVAYEREAYESTVDRYARVTFDRRIRVQPADDWSLGERPDWISFDDEWGARYFPPLVVLEIKCETHAIPSWVSDLIRRNELVRTSFSKYSIGVSLWQQGLGRRLGRTRSLQAMEAA